MEKKQRTIFIPSRDNDNNNNNNSYLTIKILVLGGGCWSVMFASLAASTSIDSDLKEKVDLSLGKELGIFK